MKKYTDSATLEHDKKIKNVHLIESWIKTGRLDKSNNFGLNVPEGTWMGMFKINDDILWRDFIKTGKVKGFSIEGLFEHKLIEASMLDDSFLEKEITELTSEEANKFLNKLKYLIKTDKRYKAKKRVDIQDMEGVSPTISSSYPGQAAPAFVAPSLLDPKTIGGPKKMKIKYVHPAYANIKK
jgi:hypothetical protein